MPSDAPLNGGCLCGAARYPRDAPLPAATYCHPPPRPRAPGAPVVAGFPVPASSRVFPQGRAAMYRSSSPVQRGFCARCGTHLTYRNDRWPDEVDVTIGSLDEPDRAAPAAHIWMEDAPRWDRPGDAL